MIRGFLSALFLWLVIFSTSQAQLPFQNSVPDAVKAELIAKNHYAEPGKKFTVGVLLRHDKGWHTYWKTTGDTGLPTTMDWKLPDGWKASDILWPVPKVFNYSGLINYGYEGEVLLPVEISIPENAIVGESFELKLKISWLMCENLCIPGGKNLSLRVQVAHNTEPTKWLKLFESAEKKLPKPVEVIEAKIDESSRAISILLNTDAPFNKSYVFAEGAESIIYSAPQEVKQTPKGLELKLVASETMKAGIVFGGVLVADEGPAQGGWARSFSASLGKGTVKAPVWKVNAETSNLSLWLAAGMALLGGLILNLMPCVFPVLSLKILALVNTAKSRLIAHGLSFLTGVLVSMVCLSGILVAVKSAGEAVGWGFQLQSPWFVALLALLFTAITINLTGGFEFAGPRISSGTSSETITESFLTGILAVVVATPCTAPFMGAALGYALAGTFAETFVVFICLGLGMAFPWVLISFIPALISWLPKPGSWMKYFKLAMAIPMGLTTLWLFWVLFQQVGLLTYCLFLLAGLCLGISLFAYGKIQFGAQLKPVFLTTSLVTIVCFAIAVSGFINDRVSTTQNIADAWSNQKVEEYLAQGKPVFVDFTASWCLTCQANKVAVLDREVVRKAFKAKGIQLLVADWTNRDEEISKTLESFGRSGVPLYVLYSPNGPAKVLPELLTTDIVLDAIQK